MSGDSVLRDDRRGDGRQLDHRPPLQALRLSREWPHLLAVFVIVLGVYAFTAPRTVTFEDDGNFIMAVEFLGTAHPPGYPLFVLLAKPFTWLPLGSVAWRVHLASACFGAIGCCLLWWVARSLIREAGMAYVAALALAFSEAMWSQAIIADVYTLNVLVFFLLFSLSLAYLRSPRPALVAAMGFVYGLGLCNHWPLLVLATPCLALVLWPARRQLLRGLPLAVPAVVLGLAPYVWMMLRSQQDPPVSFYGPLEGPRDLVYFVARRGYASMEWDNVAGWWDKVQLAGFLSREFVKQYTPFGILLAGVGLCTHWKRAQTSWNLALLAGFVGGGFGLIPFLDADYDVRWRVLYRVCPLIPYGIAAIWIVQGLDWTSRFLRRRAGGGLRLTVGAALVGALLLINFGPNDRRHFGVARDYGTALLESLPPNAILFTDGDFDTFAIGYLHLVEGMRPDVSLYNEHGLVFAGRLYHPLSPADVKSRILREFVAQSRRPVFFIRRAERPFGSEEFGLYSRVDASLSPDVHSYTVHPDLLALAHRMNDRIDHRDTWSAIVGEFTVANYAWLLTTKLLESGGDADDDAYRADLETLSRGHYGLVGRLLAAIKHGGVDPARLLEWAETATRTFNERTSKAHRARIHVLKGDLLAQSNREPEAARSYQTALEIYPAPASDAALKLMRLYAQWGRTDEYQALRRHYTAEGKTSREIAKLDRMVVQNARSASR